MIERECFTLTDDRLALLGLAARARAVTSGSSLTEAAVKSGEAVLVILAEDASPGTKKRIQDKCRFYHVPCVICDTQDSLGHRIGKEARSTVAILDPGFGKEIGKRFGLNVQEGK